MKLTRKPFYLTLIMLVCFLTGSTVQSIAQQSDIGLGSNEGQHWFLKAQAEAGLLVTDPGHQPSQWTPAIVPGTAFNSFVLAGSEKDPNFGDNISKVERSKYDRSFWYRTNFKTPSTDRQKRTWLNFRGVNRRAEIFLNGQLLGKLDGFMHRGQFDITELIKGKADNALAVLVHIPEQPLANQGSPNYVSSAGWDWMPYVPGLNSGITDKVYLSFSNNLTLHDPWVRSDLPTNGRADLSVALRIRNSAATDQDGLLQGIIMPGNIEFTKAVHLRANETADINLTKRDFGSLVIHNPRLWWPNGHGEPNLYQLKLTIKTGMVVSDQKKVEFGIKRYSYDTTGNVLHLAINGKPIFVKGGNWGMSEYMLRCRDEEYDTRVKMHKEMNFNMIRNWIGSTTDDEFYQACDKYGIMIWDDFWLNSNPNLPSDLQAFNANAIEKIKRVRNHPSIAVWGGDNEGWPEPPLGNWLKENIRTFDGGDRYFQANSHADNLTGSGPWAAKDPRFYFSPYPTGLGGNKGWGFRTEIGTAVFTNFESFKRFIPQDKWWPRNEMWNQHFFGPSAFNAGPDEYDRSIRIGYGNPSGIEDYCRKAQFVNLESNKAMYEGWLDRIGEDASGLMTWMSQPGYPSLVWQTYDYYLDLTGAYFGAKKACEPVHIQWNPVNNAVKVINTGTQDHSKLSAQAEIYNLDGKKVSKYSLHAVINSPAHSATEAFQLNLAKEDFDLAKGKKVIASSEEQNAQNVADGDHSSRWSSSSSDNEWIMVDLGESKVVGGVGLNWENAYAKAFKIEVSEDQRHWKQVYQTEEGRVGIMKIGFPEVNARFVRMQGIERGSWWGYSLYDFEIFQGDLPAPGLSDVHFIKLRLIDQAGRLVSDNLYWRGNKRKDYTALNNLKKVQLKMQKQVKNLDGKTQMTVKITNPDSEGTAAFGIRLKLTNSKTKELILPALFSDNYFTLMSGESRTVHIEFQNKQVKGEPFILSAEPYNNHISTNLNRSK